MVILLTNDDGVFAEGLTALRDRLRSLADVIVCAPEQNCSATSHKLTIDRPIRFKEVGPAVFAVDGTPVDCINVALHCILTRPPDVVLSGVNHGPNLGQDVFYSGTVAAALEASMSGLPAAALSLASRDMAFLPAAAGVGMWLARFLANGDLSPGIILNVNVPREPTGLRMTRLGRRQYRDFVVRINGPNGQRGCWIGGGTPEWEHDPSSDHAATKAGMVSITPLGQDLTRPDVMETLRLPDRLDGI